MKIKLRTVLSSIALASACSFSKAQSGLLETSQSPYVILRNVNMGDVKWKPGFWGDRVERCQVHDISYMRKIYMERALTNFKVAAKLQEGEFRGSWWHDGDFYKWVEALVLEYGDTRDPELKTEIDDIITIIAKAQETDGYINTAIQIGHGYLTMGFGSAVAYKNVKRWRSDREHELYNFGHLFTLAAIHYRITQEKSLLNIANKAADYVESVFKVPTAELAALIFNPPQIMGLVELYRSTANSKYLDLANTFLEMKGMGKEKRMQIQDHLPVRKANTAVGHAVTGLYLYSGMADVYAETGDTALLSVLGQLWNDITYKKMYITGGVGSYHNGSVTPNEALHEAFGKDYDLPNATAYNETCANISNAMFNWRMLGITGDPKYADVMETVFYNSMLSSFSLDGKSYFYTNPLRWYGKDHSLLSQDAYQRWNVPRGGICCPPNTLRTIAEIANYAYSRGSKGIWVNLYGSNQLKTTLETGAAVEWHQQTEYPWKGDVKLTCIKPASSPYSLMLRIPAWAVGANVKVNGKSLEVKPIAGTYYEIKKSWQAKDIVELELPMDARLVKADPRVEFTLHQLAVSRGPLVYCLESADAAGIKLHDILVPTSTKFIPEFDRNLLGGVTVLKATVVAMDEPDGGNGKLYANGKPGSKAPLTIKLIPYYAWNNRGIGEMAIWFGKITD